MDLRGRQRVARGPRNIGVEPHLMLGQRDEGVSLKDPDRLPDAAAAFVEEILAHFGNLIGRNTDLASDRSGPGSAMLHASCLQPEFDRQCAAPVVNAQGVYPRQGAERPYPERVVGD